MSKKILVVDDEEDIVKILSARLEQRHFDVRSVLSGEDALKSVQENPPDLIILDIMLPGLSGNEVAEKLRENNATKNIPIIFISALMGKGHDQSEGNLIGHDYIFGKPYDIDALTSKIYELLA